MFFMMPGLGILLKMLSKNARLGHPFANIFWQQAPAPTSHRAGLGAGSRSWESATAPSSPQGRLVAVGWESTAWYDHPIEVLGGVFKSLTFMFSFQTKTRNKTRTTQTQKRKVEDNLDQGPRLCWTNQPVVEPAMERVPRGLGPGPRP